MISTPMYNQFNTELEKLKVNNPINIAVCEDTKTDEEKLLAILADSQISNRCTVFESGEALLENYRPGTYDLILSDIYMEGLSGVETIARVREMDEEVPVAFVTTSTEFALESYRLSVLKYIEKPFKEKQIREILTLAKMKKDSAPALMVLRNRKEERIPYSRILYLEQQTHHLNIYLTEKEMVQLYDKLATFMPQLQENDFYSCHKSYCVNLNFVRSIDKELRCFIMQDGSNVPIRRESMSDAKKALEQFLFHKTRGLE